MSSRLKVTQQEFDQIPCNRCGACCERLWLPHPQRLAARAQAGPPMNEPSTAWLEENRRFKDWVAALVPTGIVNQAAKDGYTHQYRCSRFIRVEDGSGFCTAYDERPAACRDFPYGKPVRGEDFGACSYNVDIIGTGALGGLLRKVTAIASRLMRMALNRTLHLLCFNCSF